MVLLTHGGASTPTQYFIVLFDGGLSFNRGSYGVGSPGDLSPQWSPADPRLGSPNPDILALEDTEEYTKTTSDRLAQQKIHLPGTYPGATLTSSDVAPIALLYDPEPSPIEYYVVGYSKEVLRKRNQVRMFAVPTTEGAAQLLFPSWTVDANIPFPP